MKGDANRGRPTAIPARSEAIADHLPGAPDGGLNPAPFVVVRGYMRVAMAIRTATSTTGRRYRTSRHDDGKGKCNVSNRPATRSDFCPITAGSTIISNFAVISFLPSNIALLEIPHSAFDATWQELLLLCEVLDGLGLSMTEHPST